jgi:replication-associated recombination protein RarA
MSTPSFAFPQSLADKYRPRRIEDFAGLEKPKRVLRKFAANPYPSAWLFVGPPGTGKTTMALALAETLPAELHHIPSQQYNVSAVEDVIRQCWYIPRSGFHLVLVDEADRMSNAAQLHFLSKIDATAYPPQTIFVFTCNSIEGLEPRFLSRTRQIEFSSYGLRRKLSCFCKPSGAAKRTVRRRRRSRKSSSCLEITFETPSCHSKQNYWLYRPSISRLSNGYSDSSHLKSTT